MDGVTIPPERWRAFDGLDRLVEVLGVHEDEVRLVGGAVRDTLLGEPLADVDLATRLTPDAVVARLKAAGVRAVPTGLAHGTVTAVLDGRPVEVTTLRRDVSTDGRHAVVAYTDDWREDAARRDFTINALYANPVTGEVFDYFGGLADLARRQVRFIGDPYRRIAEDHLRILRFFRFHARFGEMVDDAGLDACAARANDLMALSRERIAAELLKLLVAVSAVSVVALMVERGILAAVLPEIDESGTKRLAALAGREAVGGVASDAIRRLAALIPPDQHVAESVGARLKLSTAQRRALVSAVDPDLGEKPEVLAYRIGPPRAIDRLLLSPLPDARAIAAVESLAGWTPPRLPLTGGALVARGLAKGPLVARTLRAVEERWIAEGFPDASRVQVIADEEAAQALRDRSSA